MKEESYEPQLTGENIGYNSKSDFSKPSLVAFSTQKCLELRSKEMKSGYYNFMEDKNENLKKVWIPDARKIFISSVVSLKNLLSPEINADEIIIKFLKGMVIKEKELFDKHCYSERIKVKQSNGAYGWKLTGDKWLPEMDESMPTDHPDKSQQHCVSYLSGYYNPKVTLYWDSNVRLYDNLFAELNNLLARLGYFKRKPRLG